MKTCRKCGEAKPLSEFHKNARAADGHGYRCKPCVLSSKADYYQRVGKARYEADRPARRARMRTYYEANREELRAKAAIWREANAERLHERQRAHREANPEMGRQRVKAYRERHPSRVKVRNAQRRAILRTVVVEPFSHDELLEHYSLMGYDGCAYCAGPYEHDDHIVPLSRGGAHSRENLAPACAQCNLSKGPKLLAEWLGFAEP